MGSVSEENKEKVEDSTKEKEVGKEKEVDQLKIVTAESIARKNEIAKLRAELDAIEAEKTKSAEAKLLKDGEYKTLLESKEAEIAKLKPDAEAYAMYREDVVNQIKESMGDSWEDAFASLPLSAMQKLAKVQIAKADKIEVDNNQSEKITVKLELTENDKEEALRRYPSSTPETAFELYKSNLLKIRERQKQKG